MSDLILEAAARAKEAGPGAINATIGVLYDENGESLIFPSVQQAMRRIDPENNEQDNSILGIASYRQAVERLLGNHPRIASIATSGGEDALSINLRLISELQPHATIAVPTPMWIKHADLSHAAGLTVVHVPYLKNGAASVEGLTQAIRSGIKHVLVQATGNNPTGFDYTQDQWMELADVMQKYGATAIVDFAYQGFTDEPEQDAFCIKTLAGHKVPILVAWSASKNHAMPKSEAIPYERIGLAAAMVQYQNQFHAFKRKYQNAALRRAAPPSAYGQRVVALVQQELRNEWTSDLREIRTQIDETRELLTHFLPEELARAFRGGRGLFALPDFKPEDVDQLRIRHNIHLPADGRVNIGGIPLQCAPKVASAMSDIKEKMT
ncbi:MAG TPA: aminotransferase class I/II-fold pyridoxal phosphate-dependent enzyme [Candidatus Peribacteraceae bacterium]|nr:aminotransferase class I/II-fold pyridoxal phosphate-dependent enzyme [Candidatus Peribacteraceae bacterium]